MECRLSGLALVRIDTTAPTDSSTPPLRSVAAAFDVAWQVESASDSPRSLRTQ